MKPTWPLDPRSKKLPRGTSITTSTSGGSGDALEAMSGLRFSSVMPQTYVLSIARKPDAANRRNVDNANRARDRWMFHRLHECGDHLRQRDEAHSTGDLSRRRQPLREPVDGFQRNWPPMVRPEHIPRSQHRCRESCFHDRRLSLCPRSNIRPHDRRRLRDADIDKVRDLRPTRRLDARPDRREVDALELGRLRRAGMWC